MFPKNFIEMQEPQGCAVARAAYEYVPFGPICEFLAVGLARHLGAAKRRVVVPNPVAF